MAITDPAVSSNGHRPEGGAVATEEPPAATSGNGDGNGHRPAADGAGAPAAAAGGAALTPLERLRRRPDNPHLFKGYGPLVAGLILFVLMVLLAPSVAPERIVEQPVGGTTTTLPGDPGAGAPAGDVDDAEAPAGEGADASAEDGPDAETPADAEAPADEPAGEATP